MIFANEQAPAATDSTLAVGMITSWVGTTRVWASPQGVRQIWLPDWHDVENDGDLITDQSNHGGASRRGTGTFPLQADEIGASDILQVGTGEAERHLRQAIDELLAYFAGDLRRFSVALDLHGPAFYRQAWAAVAAVPYGETRTYGEIAREIDAPAATRAVGAANGANPLAPIIPCHRIIASDGKLRDYGPGLPLKHRLLAMEGALPETTSAYGTWAARLGDDVLLGVRATHSICRPLCSRPRRNADRPHRVFHTLADAREAGFFPCSLCNPEHTTLMEIDR